MSFASPSWLLLLIPWAAWAAWMLIGRNPRVQVPFIELWPTNATQARPVRRFRKPPFAVIATMLATSLAVLAAARPQIGATVSTPITIILDRGATMSSRSIALPTIAGNGIVELICVPGETIQTDRARWTAIAKESEATGLNTHDVLLATIADVRRQTINPIVVISNQSLPELREMKDVIRPPLAASQNVGVVLVSARATPPAIMVRLRNQSDLKEASLKLHGTSIEQAIKLPTRESEQNYFLTPEKLDDVISIELHVRDEVAADNRAWLVRGQSSPRLEPRGDLSASVRRIIEIFGKRRPPTDRSIAVTIVDNPYRLSANEIGVALAAPRDDAQPTTAPIRVENHPITKNVRDWSALQSAATAALPPGEGWSYIVRAGDAALLALRENPARQVWIGFDSPDFERSLDFVIFWTDLLQWLGGTTQDEFRARPVESLDLNWWRDEEISGKPLTAAPSPGVYREDDGQLVALNALDVKFDTVPANDDWRATLRTISRSREPGSKDFTSSLLLSALGLLLLAALTWGAGRSAR